MLEYAVIQAIVFDLDDTLYAERDFVRSGYRAVANHLRDRLHRNEPGDPFEDWLWNRFLAGRSDGAIDALNRQFQLGLTPAELAELVEVYRTHHPDIHPCDGMSEFLDAMHKRYRLGLLTDGRADTQKRKLQSLRLERLFDVVVFTDELGRDCWKPSLTGFQAISARLNLPHETCAYVGDNPAKDFLPGNRLGWRTIRFARPGQVHAANPAPPGGEPQFIVGALNELRNALRR